MANWQDGNTIVVWLAVGFLLLILIIGALLFFTQIYIKRKVRDANTLAKAKLEHQKKLLVNSIESQEKERSRVAIDIHDGLLFELSLLSMLISQPNKAEESRKLLDSCTTLARQISHDLTPPLIESCHLNEILEGYLDQISTHKTSLFQTGLTELNFETSFKLNIVRIFQEISNNTIKHAEAKNIWLHIRTSEQFIALIYKDNGKGFLKDDFVEGLGQRNMAMRIDLLNGRYKLKTTPGKGVQYTILIPVTNHYGKN
jgi:signal transduction histidine kinase